MASYPLDKLNDKEFEELSRDILQKEMAIRFEAFRRGKDKGIDLRYSTDEDTNAIIVQVKQYQGSGIKKLLSVLRKEELPKVKRLLPKRYILVTSVPLNPAEKEMIKTIFTGFIHNTSDVFGEDDIYNSISRYPELLKSHPKLYLTSLNVLNEILNAHIRSRSNDKIKEIHSKIHLFVPNEKYHDAIRIINEEHFLIITGEPGIGKTSLADFITFQHLADGFNFTYILSDLTDAEKLIAGDEKILFTLMIFLVQTISGLNMTRIKIQCY